MFNKQRREETKNLPPHPDNLFIYSFEGNFERLPGRLSLCNKATFIHSEVLPLTFLPFPAKLRGSLSQTIDLLSSFNSSKTHVLLPHNCLHPPFPSPLLRRHSILNQLTLLWVSYLQDSNIHMHINLLWLLSRFICLLSFISVNLQWVERKLSPCPYSTNTSYSTYENCYKLCDLIIWFFSSFRQQVHVTNRLSFL